MAGVDARVIHIVENLDRGAVENWLLRMLRHSYDRGLKPHWTFYCVDKRVGVHEQAARDLGARIVRSPVPIGRKWSFIRALRKELRSGGYDVVHCHHDLVSAVYLAAAMALPIRRRIVHIHNADEEVLTPSRLKQRLIREPMRRLCLSAANLLVGISNHTLDTFLGGRRRRKGRDTVLYYGVDPTPFENARPDRIAFRRGLGLPPDTPLLLFAGRMVPEKNPLFTLDILTELRKLEPSAVAVFAGAGSLESAILQRARELGVHSCIRQLGWRDDIPAVMCCCDWFVLPRPEWPMEGLGLAVVEAQLAGLRLLLSRGIADDPLLPTASYRRLALAAGARAWAEAAVELMKAPAPTRAEALAALKNSPFDMDHALAALMALYN